MTDARRRSSSSTTCRRTSGCSRRCSRRAATRSSPPTSGREALERARRCEPVDLVLLDIVMPEMDGYEVCRALRADPATAFLPVVMITASGEQEKLAAIEAGADDFVTKPFDQAELLARVGSLLRIKRYHDTIERQAAELAAWNRRARAARAGAGRRARAAGPAAALPLAAARRADRLVRRRVVPGEPPPRDHRRLLRPARLHRLRRDRRARGRDGGARRVPRGARRPRPPLRGHARALHRRRADGLLQRPAARARTRPQRAVRMAVAMRERVDAARRGVAPPRPRPRLRRRHRPGPRDARPHRLRGPLGLRRDRHRHEPGRAAVRRGGAAADPDQPARPRRPPRTSIVADSVGELDAARASRGRCAPTTSSDSTRRGPAR